MPRRELLSPAQRQSVLALPTDRTDLMEHYILSERDLTFIRQRRGANNRVGMAVQLAFLRFPGRALQPGESARLCFLREARAAARLRHSNVASVLHLGRTGQSYFYAIEFVVGETLENLIKSSVLAVR